MTLLPGLECVNANFVALSPLPPLPARLAVFGADVEVQYRTNIPIYTSEYTVEGGEATLHPRTIKSHRSNELVLLLLRIEILDLFNGFLRTVFSSSLCRSVELPLMALEGSLCDGWREIHHATEALQSTVAAADGPGSRNATPVALIEIRIGFRNQRVLQIQITTVSAAGNTNDTRKTSTFRLLGNKRTISTNSTNTS